MNIPLPPRQDPRKRRHSVQTMTLARQLYGDGDSWTPTQIRRYLHKQGIDVSLHTVRLWVVPGQMEEHRKRNLDSYHRRKSTAASTAVPEMSTLDYMRRLRNAGLSHSSIGIVMGIYHDLPLTANQVRYALRRRCAATLEAAA